jgi:hypothetical protein
MEPLWSPVVATSGNQSQVAEAQRAPKRAKTGAVGCDRLPVGFANSGGLVFVDQSSEEVTAA